MEKQRRSRPALEQEISFSGTRHGARRRERFCSPAMLHPICKCEAGHTWGSRTRERKRSGSRLVRFRKNLRCFANSKIQSCQIWQLCYSNGSNSRKQAHHRQQPGGSRPLSPSSGAASLSANGWRRRGPSYFGAQGVTGRMRSGGIRGSAWLLCLALLGLAGQARAGTFLSANIRWVKKEGNEVRSLAVHLGRVCPGASSVSRWGQTSENPDLAPRRTAHATLVLHAELPSSPLKGIPATSRLAGYSGLSPLPPPHPHTLPSRFQTLLRHEELKAAGVV